METHGISWGSRGFQRDVKSSSRLCTHCEQTAILAKYNRLPSGQFYRSFDQYKAGMEASCWSCMNITRRLRRILPKMRLVDEDVIVVDERETEREPLPSDALVLTFITLFNVMRPETRDDLSFSIQLLNRVAVRAERVAAQPSYGIRGRPFPLASVTLTICPAEIVDEWVLSTHDRSTGGEFALRLAKYWIDVDMSQPKDSSWPSDNFYQKFIRPWPVAQPDEDFFPARLIDVGSPESPPRLVTFKPFIKLDSKERPKYLTLSHCWGNSVANKLLSDNIDTFRQEIPRNKLTKTFQDALDFTARLGIKYIWIDALCIIQDSEADWAQEASLMMHVYSGSLVNLCAVDSSSGDGGLYRSNPSASSRCPVIRSVDIEDGGQAYYLHPKDMRPMDVESRSPPVLWQRAWTFQERFCAPRNILFRDQLLFTSVHGCAWEDNPDLDMWDVPTALNPVQPTNAFSYPARFDAEPCFYVRRQWYKVVEEYSRLSLTFETDKLVAISGLAKHVRHLTQDEYLAGLWKSRFAFDLLWCVDSTATDRAERKMRYNQEYIAPSWSWASVNVLVKFTIEVDNLREARESCLASLLDYRIDLKYEDQTSQISFASVRMRGPLVETKLLTVQQGPRRECQLEVFVPKEARHGTSYVRLDHNDLIWSAKQVFSLALITQTQEDVRKSDLERLYGVAKTFKLSCLLILAMPNLSGVYRRVGQVTLCSYGKDFPDKLRSGRDSIESCTEYTLI